MSINMYLIYRCLSCASAVIHSWFIYKLLKSTAIAFSTPEIQSVKSPPCLRISNRKYPPCPQNSMIMNPPLPFGNPKKPSVVEVWIFSGIAQYLLPYYLSSLQFLVPEHPILLSQWGFIQI